MKDKIITLLNNKNVLYLLIILLIILLIASLVGNNSRKNAAITGDVELEVYYSKSSRDEEKRVENTFNPGDPIQVRVNYANFIENTALILEVKNNSNDVIQLTEIEVEGNEDSFVTVSNAEEKGRYKVSIKNEEKEMASTSFRVK